jgi:hypothetical protein
MRERCESIWQVLRLQVSAKAMPFCSPEDDVSDLR